MDIIFETYLQRLEDLFADLESAIDGLPVEALDWVPGPDMNSLAVLVVHVCGAMRYWIGDMSLGEDSGRVRADEFTVSGLSEADLRGRIRESLTYARGALARLSPAHLGRERPSPMHDGRMFNVSWSLWHALEHTALHVGHAQITRQLWDQQNMASDPGP